MVTLYTTHCPKCKVLEKKMKDKNIQYIEVTDEQKILQLGFNQAPILEVDGRIYDFKEANAWINEQKGREE